MILGSLISFWDHLTYSYRGINIACHKNRRLLYKTGIVFGVPNVNQCSSSIFPATIDPDGIKIDCHLSLDLSSLSDKVPSNSSHDRY